MAYKITPWSLGPQLIPLLDKGDLVEFNRGLFRVSAPVI